MHKLANFIINSILDLFYVLKNLLIKLFYLTLVYSINLPFTNILFGSISSNKKQSQKINILIDVMWGVYLCLKSRFSLWTCYQFCQNLYFFSYFFWIVTTNYIWRTSRARVFTWSLRCWPFFLGIVAVFHQLLLHLCLHEVLSLPDVAVQYDVPLLFVHFHVLYWQVLNY